MYVVRRRWCNSSRNAEYTVFDDMPRYIESLEEAVAEVPTELSAAALQHGLRSVWVSDVDNGCVSVAYGIAADGEDGTLWLGHRNGKRFAVYYDEHGMRLNKTCADWIDDGGGDAV